MIVKLQADKLYRVNSPVRWRGRTIGHVVGAAGKGNPPNAVVKVMDWSFREMEGTGASQFILKLSRLVEVHNSSESPGSPWHG
jgi:hypothetical protein